VALHRTGNFPFRLSKTQGMNLTATELMQWLSCLAGTPHVPQWVALQEGHVRRPRRRAVTHLHP
jgi:hypothetical protein